MKPRVVLPLLVAAIAVAAVIVSLRGNAAAPGKQSSAGANEKTSVETSMETPVAATPTGIEAGRGSSKTHRKVEKIVKTDAEWKRILTPEQYRVLRQRGTEMAFTGELNHEKRRGTFVCAACGLELFASGTKYESGSGWPSFWQPIASEHVGERPDVSLGMPRVEVVCNRCEGHLGHVFDDGPEPTGLRYCINSAALAFDPAKDGAAK